MAVRLSDLSVNNSGTRRIFSGGGERFFEKKN